MARHSGSALTLRAAALAAAAGLAACGSPAADRRAEVEIRGTDPMGGAVAAIPATPAAEAAPGAVAQPDTSGIVSYQGYQTVVAERGDTVADLAGRAGLSASELAAYNGLTPDHGLRAGDELVLPPRPGGYGGTVVASAEPPLPTAGPAEPPSATIETAPLPGSGTAAAPAATGGWSPALAEAAIQRSSAIEPDGSLGAPPSSAEPIPPEPERPRELASPDLGQYQTDGMASPTPVPSPEPSPEPQPSPELQPEPEIEVASASPGARLQRPVEGAVLIPFNKAVGPTQNDGVDFAAPAGAQVVAAADGEVALVSQSLGGLGTIVLLRHPDNLLTVYGRIADVTVSKGDIVRTGQQIGVVSNAAAPAEPRMHFEVRRGAESLDPMQFL